MTNTATTEVYTLSLHDALPISAFVKEFAGRFQKRVGGLSPGAERLLFNAPWTGNIRELRNVIERACMLSDGRILSERDRKSTRLNSSHSQISYAVFCLKKKNRD